MLRNEAISEVSDADLVAKAMAGDATAFAHLVHRHAPIAKRMARLWGAGADADDVVQDAFVKAHAALARFRSASGFRPWLLSIVHNETRNLHRGRGRRTARSRLLHCPMTSQTPIRGGGDHRRSSTEAPGDDPRVAGGAPRGRGLPVSAGTVRSRDGAHAEAAGRHRQVAAPSGVEHAPTEVSDD